MQFALASMSSVHSASHSFDDLLMAFQALRCAFAYNHDLIQQRLVMELLQALKFSFDQASNEAAEKIVRNPVLQRLLSVQAAIGFQGYNTELSPGSSHKVPESSLLDQRQPQVNVVSELARILLNLRHVSAIFLYFYATARGPNGQETAATINSGIWRIFPAVNAELTVAMILELLRTVLGSAQWFITLIEYIVDQLYDFRRRSSSSASIHTLLFKEISGKTIIRINTRLL